MPTPRISTGFTHQFSVVSSGSQADLLQRECSPLAGAPAAFLQITEPGQDVPTLCTKLSTKTAKTPKPDFQEKPVAPHVTPSFDTSSLDMLLSPKSRRSVMHPAGSNDPQVHASTNHASSTSTSTKPAAGEERGPTTRMKLSQLLKTASQQSAPGTPGENAFANLLLNAAKALDGHPDSGLLDFLEDHCSVTIKCGSISIVNPLDLRRAVTLLRADHNSLMGDLAGAATDSAAAAGGAATDPHNKTPGAVHSAPGARMAA